MSRQRPLGGKKCGHMSEQSSPAPRFVLELDPWPFDEPLLKQAQAGQ